MLSATYKDLPQTVSELTVYAQHNTLSKGEALFLLARVMGAFDTLDDAMQKVLAASAAHRALVTRNDPEWDAAYAAVLDAHAQELLRAERLSAEYEGSGLKMVHGVARALRVGAADELVSVVETKWLPPAPVSPPSRDMFIRNQRKAVMDALIYAQSGYDIAEEKRSRLRSQIRVARDNQLGETEAQKFDMLCDTYKVSID